jgi:hypothetical protein
MNPIKTNKLGSIEEMKLYGEFGKWKLSPPRSGWHTIWTIIVSGSYSQFNYDGVKGAFN